MPFSRADFLSAAATLYYSIALFGSKSSLLDVSDRQLHYRCAECQVNTAVGKRLMSELSQAGLRVVLTWNPNSPPPVVPTAEDLQQKRQGKQGRRSEL